MHIRKLTYQEIAAGLISRSQAKALTKSLPKKGRVTLVLTGISSMQLGYADEVFRQWLSKNKEASLRVLNAAPAVADMIRLSASASDLDSRIRINPQEEADE